MYLKSKKVAFLGLLTAFSVVLIILSGVIEMSTLFILALAGCMTGIAIAEFGIALGAGQFAASLILGLLLAPNKMYCLTYSMIAIYIVLTETMMRVADRKIENIQRRKMIVIGMKYLIFNLLYLPLLFGMPKLIYHGELSTMVYAALIVGGQVVLYLCDIVYHSFMSYYFREIRKRLHMD